MEITELLIDECDFSRFSRVADKNAEILKSIGEWTKIRCDGDVVIVTGQNGVATIELGDAT